MEFDVAQGQRVDLQSLITSEHMRIIPATLNRQLKARLPSLARHQSKIIAEPHSQYCGIVALPPGLKKLPMEELMRRWRGAMRHVSHLLLQLTRAGTLGIFFTLAAFADTPKTHSHFAGIYQSDPVPAGKSGPSLSLSLGEDGTATVTQDSGKLETTMFGHWVESGSQVIVTFDAQAGKAAEPTMTFQASHNGLQAVTWNHERWGKVTPPLAKKSSGNWHHKRHWW
jgi:hypothetical protein